MINIKNEMSAAIIIDGVEVFSDNEISDCDAESIVKMYMDHPEWLEEKRLQQAKMDDFFLKHGIKRYRND